MHATTTDQRPRRNDLVTTRDPTTASPHATAHKFWRQYETQYHNNSFPRWCHRCPPLWDAKWNYYLHCNVITQTIFHRNGSVFAVNKVYFKVDSYYLYSDLSVGYRCIGGYAVLGCIQQNADDRLMTDLQWRLMMRYHFRSVGVTSISSTNYTKIKRL